MRILKKHAARKEKDKRKCLRWSLTIMKCSGMHMFMGFRWLHAITCLWLFVGLALLSVSDLLHEHADHDVVLACTGAQGVLAMNR